MDDPRRRKILRNCKERIHNQFRSVCAQYSNTDNLSCVEINDRYWIYTLTFKSYIGEINCLDVSFTLWCFGKQEIGIHTVSSRNYKGFLGLITKECPKQGYILWNVELTLEGHKLEEVQEIKRVQHV